MVARYHYICQNQTRTFRIHFDYYVPGINLLRDLQEAMRLEPSVDMSVHVSTCTNYDFNALTPVVWKLWRWWDVCVSTSRRKNEWSVLEQRINVKFYVRLGKNATDEFRNAVRG
jgi:hypothetical protein